MSGPSFTDLSKESAVCGAIAVGTFELIPQASLISPDAFADPRWHVIYAAAIELRSQISDQIICAESVSDFIAFHGLDRELQRAIDSTGTSHWREWPKYTDTSEAFAPELLGIKYNLQKLDELYLDRQAAKIGSQLHEGIITGEDAFQALQEILHQSNGDSLPAIDSAQQLHDDPLADPSEIVRGILHQGSKMVVGGGSKSFKTWILLELAVCVAIGSPWLGFDTSSGKVLYLNFELARFAIRRRLKELYEAMDIRVPQNLHLWNLRGYAADANVILPLICSQAKALGLALIIIDPLYKLLGDRDENASHDMAALMNQIERLTLDTQAAIAFGAHFAKGNASLKEAIDRFSGSGVIGRDPDSILTFTQHDKPNAFTLDMILRNFPPQDPFVVRRSHPLMLVDPKLDPHHLKKPAGRPPAHDSDELLDCLEKPMTTKEWLEASDMKPTTFYDLLRQLKKQQRVFKSKIDQTWTRK
jgi:hypothetical protein